MLRALDQACTSTLGPPVYFVLRNYKKLHTDLKFHANATAYATMHVSIDNREHNIDESNLSHVSTSIASEEIYWWVIRLSGEVWAERSSQRFRVPISLNVVFSVLN